ncbi:MAG: hypothetical protein NTX49_04450 [Chlamydiae bacterium]|nr:hypothetical protein [Chlamydiota bacterium]
MKRITAILLCCGYILVGCSPGSLSDYRHEGESACRDIIGDLQSIETREDVARLEPVLKRKFEKLVSVIIEARQFQIKYPEEALALPVELESDVSDLLKDELQRVYRIEGGKEIVERAQRESMLRLDGFEKIRGKQKDLRIK